MPDPELTGGFSLMVGTPTLLKVIYEVFADELAGWLVLCSSLLGCSRRWGAAVTGGALTPLPFGEA